MIFIRRFGYTLFSGALAVSAAPSIAQQDKLAADLVFVAAELSKRAPQRLDDVTVLNGVRAQGHEMTFHLSIEDGLTDKELPTVRDTLEKQHVKESCADTAMLKLVRRGATIRYDYTEKSGKKFHAMVDKPSLEGCPE